MRLAFSGKAGSGKSTIAMQIGKIYTLERMSFAAKLKQITEEMFPDIGSQQKNDVRWIYQDIGTAFRRVDAFVWINYMFRNGILENCYVDDMRYLNEYGALKRAGFVTIRIERDAELLRVAGYALGRHPSETQLDTVKHDIEIENNGPYPFEDAVSVLVARLSTLTLESR